MELDELKLCPFCGGEASGPEIRGGSDERNGYNFRAIVECKACGIYKGASSKEDDNGWCAEPDGDAVKERAVAAWNTRTTEGE